MPGVKALRLDMGDARGPLRVSASDWRRRYLTIDLRHLGAHCGRLFVRFFAHGEAERRIEILLGLIPGVRARISLDLELLAGQRIFLRRHPGALKGVCFGRRVDPDDVSHATIELEDTGGGQRLWLAAPILGDDDLCQVEVAEPLVDELGQWRTKAWPGKTGGARELAHDLAASAAEDGVWPSTWSRFGGSLAHRFAASGYFRTHHDGRRWWLVDPDGCGFWSAGLDCVRPGADSAMVPGTEGMFTWLPRDDADFTDCWHGQGARGPSADFSAANLRRVFGDGWKNTWRSLTAKRLRAWRFNTVANWSDTEIAREQGVPYVTQMSGYPSTPMTLFRDLPDVFDPAFAINAASWAESLRPLRDDPLLIGYFLANEPEWGFGKFNLAAEMLEGAPGSHTRRALAGFVRRRYADDVAAWSRAWKRPFDSFDDLVDGIHRRLADSSPAADADLWEFSKDIVRMHARIPSEAARAVDPHHLNLGLRYAWIASDLFYEAGAFFDVFSVNCYAAIPDEAAVAEIAKRCRLPTMIGEFHFGALDRGLPATGLRGVADQVQRGVAYRRFVERCAANPDLIGAHYFTLADQSLTGRFDGENYQIGFVDVCHRPYAELVAAATSTHERLYAIADGSVSPFDTPAVEAPRVAF